MYYVIFQTDGTIETRPPSFTKTATVLLNHDLTDDLERVLTWQIANLSKNI